MGKQIKKTVVPPREERLEKIGDPKTPKMGGLTPKKIEVPEVGDLLDKMREAAPAPRSRLVRRDLTNFKSLLNFEYVSFDLETEPREHNDCSVGCGCPPCRRGDCMRCLVEAQRFGGDRDALRDAVMQYRGVIYE